MLFRSFQAKIFLIVLAAALPMAAAIMVLTQARVEQTVVEAEDRAARNIVELIAQDVAARFDGLLKEKFDTIQTRRQQLEGVVRVLRTGIDGFIAMSDAGVITSDEAEQRARTWISSVNLGGARFAFIYDTNLQIVAYPAGTRVPQGVSAFRDFKGRPTLAAALDEASKSDRTFQTFRWPTLRDERMEVKFGVFEFMRRFDWVVVATDTVQDIENDVEVRRKQIVQTMADPLKQIRIARTGFVLMFQSNGTFVVPPPEIHRDVLSYPGGTDRRSVQERLAAAVTGPGMTATSFEVEARGGEIWEARVMFVKAADWYVAALVPRRELEAPANELFWNQAVISAVTLLLGLAAAYFYASRLVQPLRKLAAYARILPNRDFAAPRKSGSPISAISNRYRDEVGALAEAFTVMEDRLHSNVQKLMAETSEREKIESELAIARDIQFGFLPDIRAEMRTRPGIEVDAIVIPAKEVGGDLYDIFLIDETRVCVAVGDVSGKGVPGAFFMGVSKTLLRAAAEQTHDAGRIVQRVNIGLSRNNPNLMFLTLFVGVLDLETGEIIYANAGHIPPIVVEPDGALRRLEGLSGPACGVDEDVDYETFTGMLDDGSVLTVYTDGVSEALDVNDELFGERRVESTLGSLANTAPPEIVATLVKATQHFAGAAPQADDITVLSFKMPAGRRGRDKVEGESKICGVEVS